ncbi:TonB-dependent receptor [Xanthobacter sp. TB0136]|uniref:TonB-dependent receptor n=1 Tax=Xanthobacter sp. TB0136 TaxID=3459177 RepID=UPI004039ABEF
MSLSGPRIAIALASVTGIFSLSAPSQALAQESGADTGGSGSEFVLEAIEVTARRDAEPLFNVPVSVGLVTSGELALESPANAAVDISRSVPNYSVTDVGNPLFAFGAIRGVGTLGFPQNPFDSTIGYALNGMPLSLYSGSQQLLDVQRVEVMRGPQNVLFGRSSQGGTVNLVTAEPDGTRDMRIRAEVGTNRNLVADVIAGGTLIPGVLNARGALRYTRGDGDVKNLLTGDSLPSFEIGAARGALRWFATERTTVTLSGFYEKDKRDTFNYILRGGENYPAVMLDEPLAFSRRIGIGTAEVRHELDSFDLTATFGVQDISSTMNSDNTDALIYSKVTGLPPHFFMNANCSDCTRYRFSENAYSGELRATSKPDAPMRWIAGLSYYHSDFDHRGTNSSSFGPTQNGYYNSNLKLDSYSAFAEIGIALDERWTLTPGVRVGHDSVSRKGLYVSNGTAGTVPTFSEYGKVSDPYIAGGVSLSYKMDENSLLYGSVRRGYSNAGFPYFNIFSVFGKDAPSYPASYVWTYEIGGRTLLLDGRLALEGSIFYNNVDDGHVNAFDMMANSFNIVALDYYTYGFEANARYRVNQMWSVYGGVGYTRSAFFNVPQNDLSGAADGNSLPGVPLWSGMLGAENRLSLAALKLPGEMVTSVEYQFATGARAADLANTFNLSPYHIINARLGWENERIKVYGFARNLFDENIEVAGTPYTADVYAVTPGLGRVLGAGIELTF